MVIRRARLKWPPEVSTIESVSLVITDCGRETAVEKNGGGILREDSSSHDAWSLRMFGVKLTIAPPRLV